MSREDTFAVFTHRDFRLYLIGRFLSSVAVMTIGVAVGWQVYDLTHSTFALGMVGLMQFLPAFVFALPGGHVADRVERRSILVASLALLSLAALTLLYLSLQNHPSLPAIFGVMGLFGVVRAFYAPASQALVPLLVPPEHFQRAVAWNSSAFQIALIGGPALGGFLYAAGPAVAYGSASVCLLAGLIFMTRMRGKLHAHNAAAEGIKGILSGIHFVRERREILGAISLDLFAVLFGGATALLPVYARDILHTGPWGLGLLRSAPAVGAALMALRLAHTPLREKAGRTLFVSVAIFGGATIAFGLSTSFIFSLVALAVLGAADMISVVVRQTLTQIRTPDAMRG